MKLFDCLRLSAWMTLVSAFFVFSACNGVIEKDDVISKDDKEKVEPVSFDPSVTVGTEKVSAVSAVLKGKANIGSSMAADLEMGILYSLNEGVIASNSTRVKASNMDGNFNYSVNVTLLDPATTYYFRSYVTQNGQDTYGETKSFTTKELSSMIHTEDASNISAVSATLNGSYDLTDVQYTTKTIGLYYGASAESLSENYIAEISSISGDFSEKWPFLKPATEYFYQVYINLDNKLYKEEVKSFTTDKVTNLSADGSANCYIVSRATAYLFPTVKGNSSESVGNVSSAVVLWESYGTSTTPSVGSIINKVSYNNNTISFTTPSTLKNGNAVIAAKDASGNILWSWHIWVCEGYNPVATGQQYYNDAGTMMDRNLGATSAIPGTAESFGLLYQWGRKDPFLARSGIADKIQAASTLTSWPAVESNSSHGTIEYSVKYPTTYITNTTNNNDWYYTGGDDSDNTRWQMTKTIYDPCPPGWMVPPGGDAGVWAQAESGSFNFPCEYSADNGMNFSGLFGDALTIWYPAAGYLRSNGEFNPANQGQYWSCTSKASSKDAYYLRYVEDGPEVNTSKSGWKVCAQSVRCLREGTFSQKVIGITLNKSSVSLTEGEIVTLTTTISPSSAKDKSVIWSSDNTSVATVDQTGKVTAVSKGTATITATAKDGSGKKATCSVEVGYVTITLNKSTLTLNEGQTETLSATITPDNANDKTLTWSSSDTSVATVDQTGKVTAVSKGAAAITATANDGSGKSASCSLTVNRLVSSISLNKTSTVIYNGKTETLTATVTPSTASNTGVTWSSSNTSVATVSSSGVVTGVARGTATITATAKDGSGKSASCQVEVKQYVTGITLNNTSLVLEKGQTATLIATVTPSNANDKSLTWSSSNTAVATVSSSGVVTGVAGAEAGAGGTTTITATAKDGSGKKATCSVFVPTDLSSSKSANCYIVSSAGGYKFKTVKGNSSTSVGSVFKAEVLWESFGTSTAPSKGDIISNVSYSDNYIAFATPSTLKNGNAVIAAKDASGNILWSWHIWVCSGYNPASTAQTYYNSAGKMMDRNLGATSASVGKAGSIGLLYQWGRKDPFLGSSSISSNRKAASTLSWPSAVSSTSSNGTVAYAVKNPTTFIKGVSGSAYDWVYSSRDNTLWQTTKTIHDPCPPGWKVPTGGSDGVWSKAANTSSSFSYTWNSTNNGMNFSGKFGSASTIWYPTAGSYFDGDLSGVVYSGSWWSCTPNGSDAYHLNLYYRGKVYPSAYDSRDSGYSVRCLQE